MLVAANASKRPQVIAWREVDTGVSSKVGVDHRAGCTRVHQDVRDLDRRSVKRQCGGDVDELMSGGQLHAAPGCRARGAPRSSTRPCSCARSRTLDADAGAEARRSASSLLGHRGNGRSPRSDRRRDDRSRSVRPKPRSRAIDRDVQHFTLVADADIEQLLDEAAGVSNQRQQCSTAVPWQRLKGTELGSAQRVETTCGWMVEAVGVEPTSENASDRISSCVGTLFKVSRLPAAAGLQAQQAHFSRSPVAGSPGNPA
ncbi:MAG: hypothetical protein JWO36_6537 [Myxococcales bacterium]|nr:hypothetical protein [Myxococcales bacterium]